MSNPGTRLRRLVALLPLIQRRGGIALAELESLLGVSRRELEGDLRALLLIGSPPYLPDDYVGAFIEGDYVVVERATHFGRPARLTVEEALALRLAIARLEIPPGAPLHHAYRELSRALEQITATSGISRLGAQIGASRPDGFAVKLSLVDRAIMARRLLLLTYYSPSREDVSTRRLRPYGRGDWLGNEYVVGFCELRGALRTFRVDRISRIEILEGVAPFEVPSGFDLRDHLATVGPRLGADAFPVRLRVERGAARRVLEDHPAEAVRRVGDGEVLVDFPAGSVQWAASKALFGGADVEVVDPPEVRAALVDRLRAFLDAEPPPTFQGFE